MSKNRQLTATESPHGNFGIAPDSRPGPAWWAIAAIVLVGLVVFSNNYGGEFIFDDYDTVVNNWNIKTFSPFWSPLWFTHETPITGRPVIALTFALNYAYGGLDVFSYHLVNNIIHILVGLVLFGMIRTTLTLPLFKDQYGRDASGYAFIVSIIWLIHPLQTEAVNYISQRTETLTSLFYLLTLFCAAKGFCSDRPKGWYLASLTACSLGMASKEIIVSVPLMVLLYDRLYVLPSFREAFKRRRTFYLFLFGTWIILLLFQLNAPHGDAVRFDGFGKMDFTPFDYFRIQLGVIVHYLRLGFWPDPLVLSYQDLPKIREWTGMVLFQGAFLSGLFLVTIRGLVRGTWWSLPALWFFAILAPSSSIVPMPYELATERRMYLPLAAIIVLVVFSGDALLKNSIKHFRATSMKKAVRAFALLLVALAFLGLGAMTHARNNDYRSAIRIWQDTVNKRPGNFHAMENLGKALVQAGRPDEAVRWFQEAAHLKPDDAEIFSNLGSALAQVGNFKEAVSMHQRAIELEPESAIDHYHLGNTFLRMNALEDAISSFRNALRYDPDLPPAHGNLGMILLRKGDYQGAENHLTALVKLAPDDPRSFTTLAALRLSQNRIDEAVALYQNALTLDPEAKDIEAELNRLKKLRGNQ